MARRKKPTRGRISVANVEIPNVASSSVVLPRIVFSHVPKAPKKLMPIIFSNIVNLPLPAPAPGTRGRFSFSEMECPVGATRGRISFGEAEIPVEIADFYFYVGKHIVKVNFCIIDLHGSYFRRCWNFKICPFVYGQFNASKHGRILKRNVD